MLQTIKIKNFALIENAEIPFSSGLNILSGETGAGKSIILEAISLLLGGRANGEVIRHGADEAVVEGYFGTEELPWLEARLVEVGIESHSHELLIKRTVHRSGKNRIFINGEIATLNMLQSVTDGLVDLCGQHEHQSLFKAAVQLALLDRFAELEKQTQQVGSQFLKTGALRDEWESLKKKEEERIQRLEFIRFQIEELQNANLKLGEDEDLTQQKKLLQSHEQRLTLAGQIEEALNGEEGVLDRIRLALNRAKSLFTLDPSSQELFDSLSRACAEVDESTRFVRGYCAKSDLSPERLQEVQERLSLITNLKRKYGQSIEDVLAHHQKLSGEMDLLENLSSRLEEISTVFEKEREALMILAKGLFAKRKKGADQFAKAVTQELKELRMQDTVIDLALQFVPDLNFWGPESLGTEISFQVQTNLGEEKKPIQKIVSGGELSRLMLAIRRVIADRGGIGVYLFDEIDAGLGGQTAYTVGKKLKSVAQYNQVICITHVPQVACFADHHLSIAKHSEKGRTVTQVTLLQGNARREEVARMLGAEKLTPSAMKNAKDLIEGASL